MRHDVVTGYMAIGYGCNANWEYYKKRELVHLLYKLPKY